MRSRYRNTNTTKSTLTAPHIEDVCGDSMHCCSGYSLLPCIINAELTVLTAILTPPPRLTINKYYFSQNSVAFKGVLSLSCPRAFRLARNGSSRAVFVAFSFAERVSSDKGVHDETTI